MKDIYMQEFQMYCPNCGKLITGYASADGKIKYQCGRCLTVSVSVKKSRRHHVIDVFNDGEE